MKVRVTNSDRRYVDYECDDFRIEGGALMLLRGNAHALVPEYIRVFSPSGWAQVHRVGVDT